MFFTERRGKGTIADRDHNLGRHWTKDKSIARVFRSSAAAKQSRGWSNTMRVAHADGFDPNCYMCKQKAAPGPVCQINCPKDVYVSRPEDKQTSIVVPITMR
jgi:hypothetical protein